MAVTLTLYVARQFMAAVLSMLAALSGIVSLFDFIELLRRSATKPDATFGAGGADRRYCGSRS